VLCVILPPILAPGAGSHAQAAQAREQAQLQEISVGYVESFASEILGETRELEIRLPEGYDVRVDSYLVFVVLDGGAWFRYLVSILDMISPNHLPEMIVVGLPNTDRSRDLDPADSSLGEVGAGARRFQRFLIDELLPHLDNQYRTAPYRILAGHSLAGLAVMYNLITDPEAFHARFASSPSVVSDGRGELIREGIERLNAEELAGRFLLLSAGGKEPLELHEAVANLAQLLEERSDGSLRTEWRIYEGEGHFPIKGFYEGLRVLFGDWFPAEDAFRDFDWPAIEGHYQELTGFMGFPVKIPLGVGASIANRMARAGNTLDAISVLREMAQLYPRAVLPLRKLAELTGQGFEGPYLGQTPPSMTARLFAGGELVQTAGGEKRSFNLAFSPDGTELFFSYYKGTDEQPEPEYEIKSFRTIGGTWIGPLTASFSGIHSDVDINFSPDGEYLCFASDRRDPEGGGLDIYYMRKEGEGWSVPVFAGPEVNSVAGEVYPSISEQGNLFFRSSRPGGYSDSDLYRAEWRDGEFVNVRNLGPQVNSPYGQSNSFVAADESYILFVSRRPDGGDVYQIYVSFQIGDNQWTEAVLLGEEVNTPAGAGAPTLSPDGKYLFFKRRDGEERGLYWISTRIIDEVRREVLGSV
jgi:predicted alpha/beta superfamily hydrolase